MRVVLAGSGLRPTHVLSVMKEMMPELEMVGFYDPQPTYIDDLGPDIPRFDTVNEMLANTKPDLFFVGSPNAFHLDQIREGLEAGVRIFTEKPVVVTVAETMELAALLAKYGTDRVMVGLVLRYSQHMWTCGPRWRRGSWGVWCRLRRTNISRRITDHFSCATGGG